MTVNDSYALSREELPDKIANRRSQIADRGSQIGDGRWEIGDGVGRCCCGAVTGLSAVRDETAGFVCGSAWRGEGMRRLGLVPSAEATTALRWSW